MESRGNQAWGWTDGDQIVKDVGAFRDGFNSSMLGSESAIVHTRLATFGAKIAENAHPFNIKGIIGVHNGMIYNHKEVAEKYGITYQVDSEIIFHAIADGIPLTELEGYGTTVFYRDGKIHLGRFSTRGDLHLAMTDAGWVWASTKDAVLNATGISGINVKFWVDTKLGKLYQLDGENIYKTDTDLTLSERAPITGPKSWQDYAKGGVTYANGVTTYTGASYKGGAWDDDADFQGYGGGSGGWYGKARQNSLPLPTAATTTFTAEPSSDADEVIDVEDPSEFGEFMDSGFGTLTPLAMAIHVMGSTSDEPEDEFYASTACESFIGGIGKCDDCFELLDEDQPVFVGKMSGMTFCTDCHYLNNVPDDLTDDELAWEQELDERAAFEEDMFMRSGTLRNLPANSGHAYVV
jgi:hypothetical protein